MISSTPCLEELEIASTHIQKNQIQLNNWNEDSRDVLFKLKTARILNHQKVEAEIKELEKKRKEFEQQARINSFTESEKQELEKLNEEIRKLTSLSERKQQLKEVQNEKLKENENAVKQKTEDITSKESDINKQLEKLEKGIKYFEEYLGLQVKRNPESHLTFVFTQIDEKSPGKEYSFDLAVEGSPGVYKVHNCSYHVDELEIYLDELNGKNNLKQFLCQMRNAFKKASC